MQTPNTAVTGIKSKASKSETTERSVNKGRAGRRMVTGQFSFFTQEVELAWS